MKKLISRTGMMIAIGILGLAASAMAETSGARAKIPFQFVAGDKVLPAGVYRVEVDPALRRIELRLTDGSAGLFLSAAPVQRSVSSLEQGVLVFQNYGTTCVLRKVWMTGRGQGLELRQSKTERRLTRTTKGNATANANPIEVTLASAE